MHRLGIQARTVWSKAHRGLHRKHSGSNVLAKHYHATGNMARDRTQIGVRLSSEAVAILAALQEYYAARAGLTGALSQSQAVEIMLRETAKREGLKAKGGDQVTGRAGGRLRRTENATDETKR